MDLEFKVNAPVAAAQFFEVGRESTLCKRRPTDDPTCMKYMPDHSNLMGSARKEGNPVGIARSVTDFHFASHLSDLAVDRKYPKKASAGGSSLAELSLHGFAPAEFSAGEQIPWRHVASTTSPSPHPR